MKNMLKLFVLVLIIVSSLFAQFDKCPILTGKYKPSAKDLFDIQGSFDTQAAAWQAVATDGNYIYTTKWSGVGEFEKYDMNGTFIEAFTIADAAAIRDFAYDGEYFYGSPANTTLFKLDLGNQLLVEVITVSGVDGIRHLSYASETDTFWGGNWTSLYEFDRSGTVIQSISGVSDAYGSAYDNWTSGGPYLWVYNQGGSGATLQQLDIATTSFTGVTYDVLANVPGTIPGTSIAGGAESTDLYLPGTASLLCNIQQDPNMIVIFELANTTDPQAPAQVQNVSIVPGAMGFMETELSWTNPTTAVNGSALNDLTEIIVYRDEEIIQTFENPQIGGVLSFTDHPDNGGYKKYKIIPFNSYGAGEFYTETVWVGSDVPGKVTDLTLEIDYQNEDVILNWVNPVIGGHGGYMSEIISYEIERNDGQIFVLDGIHTTFTDENPPSTPYFIYRICVENEVGYGDYNEVYYYWNPTGYLIYEEFETFPPEGWTISGGENWVQGTTNNAGGTAPEAMFNWNPATVGDQYLITPALNVEGTSKATASVTFKHCVNHYGLGYDLKFVYSTDMTNWTEIWSITPDASVSAEELNFGIQVDPGQVYFAWLFSGDSFQINYWYIDDVMIEIYDYHFYQPPENVVATLNDNTVSLSWNAPNSKMVPKEDVLDYYEIYRNEEYLGQSDTLSYTDMLSEFGEYTYSVKAIYEDGGHSFAVYSNTINYLNVTTWVPQWVEYGNIDDYEYLSFGIGGSPAKYAITFDFSMYENAYLSSIQTGTVESQTNATWQVVEVINNEPSDIVIGNLEGSFNTIAEEAKTINIMDYDNDLGGQKVSFVIGSHTSMLGLDITSPGNENGDWINVGYGWVHLSSTNIIGNWFIRAYVNNGVGVEEILPGTTTLLQNYPNPFNPTTTINFFSNINGKVELNIFNSNGELVKNLMNENIKAGNHSVMFDATEFNSGVYFYTLKTPTKTLTKKMALVK
ncbi:MAG: choice-of-anchor J domain-containing protein [Candidatus Delongbacteria bacterium]|nr:choice-of-anchor J domain-containing protein [Candidatus Delongbacteria bacterium]MBN2833914.1 choice-of-anchor J domain-containing protein [Candidatus Delongbacteria bacterium]